MAGGWQLPTLAWQAAGDLCFWDSCTPRAAAGLRGLGVALESLGALLGQTGSQAKPSPTMGGPLENHPTRLAQDIPALRAAGPQEQAWQLEKRLPQPGKQSLPRRKWKGDCAPVSPSWHKKMDQIQRKLRGGRIGAQLRKIQSGPMAVEAVELRLTSCVSWGHARLGQREKEEEEIPARRNNPQGPRARWRP